MSQPDLPIQCSTCIHFVGDMTDAEEGLSATDELACDAFPDGIPEDIQTGEFDHTQPHEGDHGITYQHYNA